MIKLRRLSRRGTTWCYGGPDAAPVTTESGHGRRRARPPSPPRTLRAPPSHVGTVVSLSVIHPARVPRYDPIEPSNPSLVSSDQ
jgi:hypothetical protein